MCSGQPNVCINCTNAALIYRSNIYTLTIIHVELSLGGYFFQTPTKSSVKDWELTLFSPRHTHTMTTTSPKKGTCSQSRKLFFGMQPYSYPTK